MLGTVQGKARRERQRIRWIEGVAKETNKSLREIRCTYFHRND